jgi:hypothetical protein
MGSGYICSLAACGRSHYLAEAMTARGYEGYVHELFNETGREAVFVDLTAWLEQRAPEAQRPKLTRVADGGLSAPASP